MVLLSDASGRNGRKGEKGVEEEWPRAVIHLGVMHLSLIVRRNYAPPYVST